MKKVLLLISLILMFLFTGCLKENEEDKKQYFVKFSCFSTGSFSNYSFDRVQDVKLDGNLIDSSKTYNITEGEHTVSWVRATHGSSILDSTDYQTYTKVLTINSNSNITIQKGSYTLSVTN